MELVRGSEYQRQHSNALTIWAVTALRFWMAQTRMTLDDFGAFHKSAGDVGLLVQAI